MSRYILYDLHGTDTSLQPRCMDTKHARITVMGDSLSGKTSFILRCISDSYIDIQEGSYSEDIYHSKVNLNNLAHDINIPLEKLNSSAGSTNSESKHLHHHHKNRHNHHAIELLMLDTAEFEIADFSDIRNEQILQSDAFILCFDLSNIESFLNLRTYQRRIERVRGMDDQVPILIVGTKSDLLTERDVDINDVIVSLQRFEISNENYFEISSKLNINVKNVLFTTLTKINEYKTIQRQLSEESEDKNNNKKSSSNLSSSFSSPSPSPYSSETQINDENTTATPILESTNVEKQKIVSSSGSSLSSSTKQGSNNNNNNNNNNITPSTQDSSKEEQEEKIDEQINKQSRTITKTTNIKSTTNATKKTNKDNSTCCIIC